MSAKGAVKTTRKAAHPPAHPLEAPTGWRREL
jgi:hypothetical protein